MNNCIDSDESSYISAPLLNDSEHVPIHLISEIRNPIENDDIPDISIKNVDAYFLYHKNSTTGGLTTFKRPMNKKRRNSVMKDLSRTLNSTK